MIAHDTSMILHFMKQNVTCWSHMIPYGLLDIGRGGEPNRKFFCEIVLATEQERAVDLSCRACGAGAWALGLDSRWGSSAPLLFSPPTSDIHDMISLVYDMTYI